MQIKVNGETDKFPENSTIRDVVSAMTLQGDIVMVALNGEIVKPETWNVVKVNPNDKLEIIKVVGGG